MLGGLSLLTLIPTPVTYIIGAAASIANAALYAEEGNYFAAICNAIPVFGGGFSLLGKAGNASCWLMKTLQYSTAGLSIGVGTYDLYQIGKGNYQKYVVRGEDFSLGDMFSDLFRGAMDVVSIAGGAKLASEKISYCFVAGTLVTTEDGQKPIEEIQVGDKVLSEDETTGEVAVKTVTETYVNETDELIHIGVNGETISATPSHPFYVNKFGWTLAGSLKAGDVLVLSNGELVTVEWVQHEILESPIKVYNFEVEDFHTYFVGESSVLVHNECGPDGSKNDKTLITGEEWYRYFQEKYGVENVSWDVHSFDDILNHPASLRNYSADEISNTLGNGWIRDTYGSNGSGWKFIQEAHPDNMVFYHGGGGEHIGAYYGVSRGGKHGGRIKIVDINTYLPTKDDPALIIYNTDW